MRIHYAKLLCHEQHIIENASTVFLHCHNYWFNNMLIGYGQLRWERDEEKWLLVKDKLNISSACYVFNICLIV